MNINGDKRDLIDVFYWEQSDSKTQIYPTYANAHMFQLAYVKCMSFTCWISIDLHRYGSFHH